ncbi:response regulator [Pontibacter roseus]|uniref:response regulator n=1 Tax=Pontibacter roseus TaxID=336989 RepID=UPI000366345B|nr:response regulator [Pontibacter roseus]
MNTNLNSILLIDDDQASNFINELLIQKANITQNLLIARNGKEAIDIIQERCLEPEGTPANMPNLILLDINMPVMDGFGFLEAFENMDCPSKESAMIAVLTTSLNPRDEERVKAAGIRHFLNKPLTKAVLEQLISVRFGQGERTA